MWWQFSSRCFNSAIFRSSISCTPWWVSASILDMRIPQWVRKLSSSPSDRTFVWHSIPVYIINWLIIPFNMDFLNELNEWVGNWMPISIFKCGLDQKRNSRLGTESQFAFVYATNFSSPRTIEGHVINCVFKPLVTRMTSSLKLLKSSENVVTYLFN